MTGWDILDKFLHSFPPIAATALLVAAAVVFIFGFSKHGLNFLKYGFKQIELDSSLEKRFDKLEAKIEAQIEWGSSLEKRFDKLEAKIEAQIEWGSSLEKRFDKLEAKIEYLETNHFGHLKNYLGILNGVLLDKQIIDNETKARLDNELRGM